MNRRFSFFNYEMGYFIRKKPKIVDLPKVPKFSDKSCNDLCHDEKNKWQLEFDVEKRIQAITGYNFETKNLDENGTCLLRWLFRDVHTNVLYSPNYFDAVMDVPLENTENWREILVRNEANVEQIQLFNICCGNKLRFVMEKIASENYDLFVAIMHHYDNDNEFEILITSVGDLK